MLSIFKWVVKTIMVRHMWCKYEGMEFKSVDDLPISDSKKEELNKTLRLEDIKRCDMSAGGIRIDYSLPMKKRLRYYSLNRCPNCDKGKDDDIGDALIIQRDFQGVLIGKHDHWEYEEWDEER